MFVSFWVIDFLDSKAAQSEYYFSELTTYEYEYLLSPALQSKFGKVSTTEHVDQMIRTRDNDVIK